MAEQQLKIDLNGLRVELQKSLQEVICLVAAGLNSSDTIELEGLKLPTSIQRNFARIDGADLDKVKRRYSEWLLTCGFRDSIESVSTFLENAHKVLTCWELAEKKDSAFRIPRERWDNDFVREVKKFHRLGFPDKLNHLAQKHAMGIKDTFKAQILSINSARNCLVHRRGIVGEPDENVPGALLVKWLRMKLFLRNEEGDRDLVIGETIEKEGTICMVHEEKQKSFSLRTMVNFSVDEFSELTWSFFLFAEELVKSINAYGVDQGFIPKAEPARA